MAVESHGTRLGMDEKREVVYIRKFALHDYHFEKIKNDSNFVLNEETNIEVIIQEDHST